MPKNPNATRDPAYGVVGAPHNFSRVVIPHVTTFSGLLWNISKVYRNPDRAYRESTFNALSMRNDSQLMAVVKARQRMTALLNWHLEPEDEKDPRQKGMADHLTKIIKRTHWFLRYRQWLMEAIWYGRVACQNIYEHAVIDGKPCFRIGGWQPINGDKLVFEFPKFGNPYGGAVGLRIQPAAQSEIYKQIGYDGFTVKPTQGEGMAVFLPPWARSLLTIHRHEIEDADYTDNLTAGAIHGIGIRHQIYATWILKQEALAMLIEFIERVGLGFTIYYYDSSNPQSKAEVEDIAKNHTGSTAILFPKPIGDDNSPYGVERIEPSAGGIDALRGIIEDMWGDMILRYVVGATLPMKSEATGLGSGAAPEQAIQVNNVVKFDAGNLEDTMTDEFVLPLRDMNCPDMRNVHVRFCIDVDDPNTKDKLDAAKAAVEMGLKLRAADVREAIGFSAPQDDDETVGGDPQQQQGGQPQGDGAAVSVSVPDLAGLLKTGPMGDMA